MLKFSNRQTGALRDLMERRFVGRLLSYLERNCPSEALPAAMEARLDFVRERVRAARGVGLTWQSSIAEHSRLSTLRRAGRRVVDPDKLVGDHPRVADAAFAHALRRAALVNRVKA